MSRFNLCTLNKRSLVITPLGQPFVTQESATATAKGASKTNRANIYAVYEETAPGRGSYVAYYKNGQNVPRYILRVANVKPVGHGMTAAEFETLKQEGCKLSQSHTHVALHDLFQRYPMRFAKGQILNPTFREV